MSVLHLTDADFAATIATGVTLVDFWAPWCGPCKRLGPVLEEIAPEYDGRAKIAKVDIDQFPALAAQYGVLSIPTILIVKDGQVQDTMMGLQQAATLRAAIDGAL